MNNTIVRSLSGVVFLLLIIGSLLLTPGLYLFLILCAVVIMTWEFITISTANSLIISSRLAMFLSALIYTVITLYFKGIIEPNWLWLIAPLFLLLPISLLFESGHELAQERGELAKGGFLLVAPLYTSLPFAVTGAILFNSAGEFDPKLMLSLFLLLWSCDVGAYIFGMLFGQKNGHKLYPSVSPKKSWEGFFGGLVSALTASLLLFKFDLLTINLLHIFVVTLIVFIFSVVGDLFESLFKRHFGVKDSGSIMPGHGGLLDRFDGALFAFPAAIAYIKLIQLF